MGNIVLLPSSTRLLLTVRKIYIWQTLWSAISTRFWFDEVDVWWTKLRTILLCQMPLVQGLMPLNTVRSAFVLRSSKF